MFCIKCGCTASRHLDHRIPYPEIWIEDFCLRCNAFFGGADNSDYKYELQYYLEENS